MAFAANSVLCRLALGQGAIDALSFTAIRILSGAGLLLLIARGRVGGSWMSGAMLFLYAIGFSLAYLSLTAGTGALLLFGSVQATMITGAIARGERPSVVEWTGLVLALAGLVYLLAPGLEAPPLLAGALMILAGVAWGIYSLRGRGSSNPVGDTAGNFVRAGLPAVLIGVIGLGREHLTGYGVALAVLSGAVTSGLGYVIWFAALRGLTAMRAALVQLAVPLIAAEAGVLFIGEHITLRLVWASLLILGGIGLAIAARSRLTAKAR